MESDQAKEITVAEALRRQREDYEKRYFSDAQKAWKESEIDDLRQRIYGYTSTYFPLGDFFNDAVRNKDPHFLKDKAFDDFVMLADQIDVWEAEEREYLRAHAIGAVAEKIDMSPAKDVIYAISCGGRSCGEAVWSGKEGRFEFYPDRDAPGAGLRTFGIDELHAIAARMDALPKPEGKKG